MTGSNGGHFFAVRNAGGCRWTSPCCRPARCVARCGTVPPFALGSGSCARTGSSIHPHGGYGRTIRSSAVTGLRHFPFPAAYTGSPYGAARSPPHGTSSVPLRGCVLLPNPEETGSGYACRQGKQDRVIRQDGDRLPQPSSLRPFPLPPGTRPFNISPLPSGLSFPPSRQAESDKR